MKNIIYKYVSKIMFVSIFLMFITGCVSSNQQASQNQSTTPPALSPPAITGCNDKTCFISAANDCKDTSLTLTEDFGVLKYSSKDCIFTKTLVSLNANETEEMKTLLEGKSMTCKYENGKFDQRLVTSLIYGTEYCDGELKDALGQLIVFA